MTHFLTRTEPEKSLSLSTFVITPTTSRTPSRIIGLSSNFFKFSSRLLDAWSAGWLVTPSTGACESASSHDAHPHMLLQLIIVELTTIEGSALLVDNVFATLIFFRKKSSTTFRVISNAGWSFSLKRQFHTGSFCQFRLQTIFHLLLKSFHIYLKTRVIVKWLNPVT